MKKMISALLIATVLTIVTAGNANAQGRDKNIVFIPAKNQAAYAAFINQNKDAEESTYVAGRDNDKAAKANAKAAKASLKAIKANNKALKNFNASYKKDNPEATWHTQEDGIVASFSKDNVKTKVVYSKRGKWFHTLTYLPADKTPEDIAALIDYAYPRDDIKLTVKVEEGSTLFYIVQLEGKTTLKKVTVYNGELNQVESFIKSN